MSKQVTITDLTEQYVDEVSDLCRRELGPDYHSKEDFRKCLDDQSGYFCRTALDADGHVCGFCMSMLFDPAAADKYLKLPDSAQRTTLLSAGRIGILESAAIDKKSRSRGLGKTLIHENHKMLVGHGAHVVCAMVWKDIHGVAGAQKIVSGLGLEEAMEIRGYWNTVTDDPEGHRCPVCGDPPCRCFGVLYLQYINPKNA